MNLHKFLATIVAIIVFIILIVEIHEGSQYLGSS